MDKSKSSPSLSSLTPLYRSPAHDPFHLVLIICLILGCGTLLAYNALVSCSTYFNHQFPDYPSIEFTIVPVFSIPNLICIILMIPFGDRLSWNFKILGCFSILAVLVLSIPYITDPHWNIFGLSQTGGYYAFLGIVAVIGCVSAVLQCAITAFCGLLPTHYLQTVLAGQSVSGILVCFIRIGSKVLLPLTPQGVERSGKLYFMVSAGVCIVCALSFYYARHSEFVKHHVTGLSAIFSPHKMHRSHSVMAFSSGRDFLNRTQCQSQVSRSKLTRISLRREVPIMCSPSPSDAERIEVFDSHFDSKPRDEIDWSQLTADSVSIPIVSYDQQDEQVDVHSNFGNAIKTSYGAIHSSNVQTHDTLSAAAGVADKVTESSSWRANLRRYICVFSKIAHLVLAIWLSMCGTFLWFPGVIAEIPSSFSAINEAEWMPLILILEFNVFDYIGRQFLCNLVPSWLDERDLWKMSVIRAASYPVFIGLLRQWVVSDVVLHLVMMVSALSNGYVASLSFMFFPKNVRKNEQQTAASLMTLGLILGILSGSTIALLLRPFISMPA